MSAAVDNIASISSAQLSSGGMRKVFSLLVIAAATTILTPVASAEQISLQSTQVSLLNTSLEYSGAVDEFLAGITSTAYTVGITQGAGGVMWFTEAQGDRIGTITPEGKVTEFPISPQSLPPNSVSATAIVRGREGNMWFNDATRGAIGKITPAGVVTEYPASTAHPQELTVDTKGNIWYVAYGSANIFRMSPTGSVTTFATNDNSLNSIAAGPDNTIWATTGSSIIRITADGQMTTLQQGLVASAPVTNGVTPQIGKIIPGPDGNMWFTDARLDGNGQYHIGRITPTGNIREFVLPYAKSISTQDPPGTNAPPRNIAFSNHTLWFTLPYAYRIGNMTMGGKAQLFTTKKTLSFSPTNITTGPKKTLWITGYGVFGAIGKLTPGTPKLQTPKKATRLQIRRGVRLNIMRMPMRSRITIHINAGQRHLQTRHFVANEHGTAGFTVRLTKQQLAKSRQVTVVLDSQSKAIAPIHLKRTIAVG